MYKHPLYLREHSKRILRSALFNDSECIFATRIGVAWLTFSFVPLELECDGLFPGGRGGLGEARARRWYRGLHPHVHLVSLLPICICRSSAEGQGQKARIMGQGLGVLGWSRQGRAHHRHSQTMYAFLLHFAFGTLTM